MKNVMRDCGKKVFITVMAGATIFSSMLSGCAGNANSIQTETEIERESNSVAASSAEILEADEAETTSSKNTETDGIGTIKTEAVSYFGSTYGVFLKKGGEEAEFLHGGRYIAACTDLYAYVVYVGELHDDTTDFTIEDDSEFLRLEGNLQSFFTGTAEEMTAEEFIKQLEENYSVSSEYRESAGTAYYVSGEDYIHIELTPLNAEEQAVIIEIACKEGESIAPDSYTWVMSGTEDGITFADIPKDFTFSSGAGGWSTDIVISEDGTFTGQYHDSDMGVTGEGYPNGTLYICGFSGKFSDLEPTDNDYTYRMKLEELNIENADKIGTEEIVDETLYVYTTPYGFDDADEFLIHVPGAALSEMTEECRSWIFLSEDIFKEVPEGYYVIYNVGGQQGFTGQSDDAIWYRSCTYDYGEAYAYFSPSYYSGSYLSFFTDHDSPAAVSLNVPWDGKNTEPMECKRAWSDNEEKFRVTIEPTADSSSDKLKYNITVEAVTDPDFDFSPWGGSAGTITVDFSEDKE